ncbi:MAG: Caib/baif family protein [Parcubacteria group bacterium Gr01-1014_24]|nr:MAG: Caib/baif family protein [Parcubacteria group bacterium Gr01-1014_24]
MQKNCKNCKKDFEIDKEDLDFYEKMKALAPNYCPPCRMARRLCFRNERTLYKRTCSKSGKQVISIYPENTPFPVYDQHVWWGDEWDAIDYGQDYKPNRSFFEQFLELKNKVPRISLLNINSVNSEYCNNVEDHKNCYLVFAAQLNEDCMYGRLMYRNKFAVDSDFIQDSELCYECIDSRKCHKCLYSENCEACIDLLFCFDMRDCQNCIFSTNLRHKKYHIFNQPVSKEEYEQKKKEIFSSYAKLEEAEKEFEDLKKLGLVKFSHQVKCKNATGDYMYNCHDVVRGFDTEDAKNCKYVADAEGPIDSYDLNNTYYKPELCLDSMGMLQTYNVKHCAYTLYSSNSEYCDSLNNSDSCFGCVGLKKKKYCILNKQYSKEEYEKLKEQIIESMKKEGVYGDFSPPSLSPFGYNETLAMEYFPMSEKEAKEKNFNWQKETSGTYGKETIKEENMPQTIEEVTEDPPDGRAGILNQVLVCKDCKKNFRITKSEFDFYKRMNIPLPHKDFECRHQDRMKKRNPRQLWRRACMCGSAGSPQATANHGHEGKCLNEFETSYSPDRPETVYCETCYQQEVS